MIGKCYNGYLREKLLQQGDILTLEKPQTLGRAIENAKKDTQLLGGEKSQSFPEKSNVSQINKCNRTRTLSNAKTKSCFKCGRDDHLANDEKYRAKGAECRKCKKIGLYAKYGRSSGAEKEERKVKAVQQTCQDTVEYHHEYVYYADKDGGLDFKIDVEINGKPVEMIIDTGSARTLLPKCWFRDNINSPLKQSNAKFLAFGGGELNCLVTFNANVKCKTQEIVEPVFVIDVDGPPLLGRSVIQALNLVKIYAVGWAIN